MKIAYLDCSSGVSGDMLLGAIVDSGLPLKEMEDALKGLHLKGYRLEAKKVKRSFISATKVNILLSERKGYRHVRTWEQIRDIVKRASLPSSIKERGLRIFKSLFEAEGKVHGQPFEMTHLHELGAIDCIIDIFGTLIGLKKLGIERVYSSSVNLGSGTIKAEHGLISVPAPAVIELLKGIPVYSSGAAFELTTPTGAALIREIVNDFIPLPVMTISDIGYGAGTKDPPDFSNVLRLIIGTWKGSEQNQGEITIIETNIDDMNPQVYEYLSEILFRAGAIDVFMTQVIMKKGRPGILLTVLCNDLLREKIADILFRETTTLGIRFYKTSRITLQREVMRVSYGKDSVKLKVAELKGYKKSAPEYEDCKRIAKKRGIPLIHVMRKVERDEEAP